ncbi:ZIP family metal transporter [Zemynaea arenosa]|nr:transporter [Massilia arenosa]
MLQSLGYASIPALAVLVGTAVAMWRVPGDAVRSGIQHLAAGVVFCVLATELLPDLVHRHMPWVTLLGFSLGVVVLLTLKFLQPEDALQASNGAMLAAVGVDVFLDGLLIGLSFAAGQVQSMLLTVGLTLELGFLGVAIATTLAANRTAGGRIITTAVLLGVVLVVGAGLGAWALTVLRPSVIDGLLAVGVAALLYLVTEELLVEAHEVKDTPLQTGMFFFGFIALWTFEMLI